MDVFKTSLFIEGKREREKEKEKEKYFN